MEDLQRIDVKLFLADPDSLSPETAFRTFAAWVADPADEVLIDVADYSHVPCGPLTVLVGHESHYVLDDGEHRRGLVYSRRQPLEGGLAERLAGCVRRALCACQRLEHTQDLAGAVRFRGDELLLVTNDRLRAADTEEAMAALRPQVQSLAARLFPGIDHTVEREPATDGRLRVRVRAASDPGLEQLLAGVSE